MFAKNGLESEKASLIKNCPFGFFSRLAFKKKVLKIQPQLCESKIKI